VARQYSKRRRLRHKPDRHRLKLCTTIRAEDVTDTLELALAASGCDQGPTSDTNRACCRTTDPAISPANWQSARGAPFHPQTQGKIERWHQTLKNRVLLENCFLPGDLERQIEAFIEHYNHWRTLHSPGLADHGRVMRCISFTA
jgi:putative transposase